MLKALKTHHKEIVRLNFQGLKPSEVAEKTGTKLQTVYKILRDPLANGYLAGLQDKADKVVINVRERLADMNEDALNAIGDLLTLEGIPRAVQLSAAKDVLDRNGHKPVERHQHAHAHFTSDDLKELKERASNVDGAIDI